MYIIETGLKTGSFVNIMEIENKHIEDLIYSYLMGDISEEGRNELLQWLETDDAHKQCLSEMADCWATAHVPLFASDMKADFQKYFGALIDPAIPSEKNHWLNFRFLGKVAASVLIVVSVGTASYYIGTRHNQPKSAALAYFETTTPMGAQTKVVLPDQSVVWVNAGSTLRYGSDFNTSGRSVQLDGEAYFEITRDSLKPFIVKSKKLDIKVLGTSFNVKAYGMDEMTDVTLVSGKVNVSLRDEVAHAGDVTLTPNRKLSFNKQTNKVRVSEVDAKDALSWMDGSLKFSEQPFMSIAKDLERKFNVRIRVESDLLRKEIFSGSFTKEDLLHETGKNTDAREAFIHPQYKKNDAGDQIPAFRFVANLYTDGKISGYVYRQGETKEVGGKLIATVDDEEYTLTPVDVDNKRYSISYKGKTYVGDYDYLMLESQGNPKFYSYKCSKQEGYPHLYSPVISRLGELYLIRAEASAKLGNYTKALADLNTVRTRSLPNAGYKSLDATNAHELIMKERQLELAYEADRGFDVYRVGDTMKRHYPGFHDGVPEYPATSPLAIQYIPQSEINAYPGTLTQNP